MKTFNSIKFRLTSGISFLIIVITVLLSVLSYEHERKAVQNRIYAQLNATADLKKELVVNYVDERINDLRTIATAEYLRNSIFSLLDKKTDIQKKEEYRYISQRLRSLKNIYRDYLSIEITDLKGHIIVSTNNSRSDSTHSHKHDHRKGIGKYMENIKRGSTVIMQDYLNSETRHLDFAVGIRGDDGNLRAIIVSSIVLKDTIFAIFSDYAGLGYTGETLLVRLFDHGLMHINPTRHSNILKMETHVPSKEHFKLGMSAASGKEGMDEGIDYRGKKVIGAYRYIPALGWGIVAKIDADEAFKEIAALRKEIIILAALLLGITLAASYIVLNKFTGPVIRLTQRTREIISGNYSIRINSKRKDEIGELERDFDEMVSVLDCSRKEVAQKQLELEQSNFQLDRKVKERTAELTEANTVLLDVLEDIKSTEEKFRQVLNSSVDAVVISDETKKILFLNKAAENMFGYKREDIISKEVEILIPEKYKERHRRGFERYIANGKGTLLGRVVELYALKNGGEEFPVELSLSGWESKGRKYLSAVIRDITERKKLEEMLMHAQKMEAIGQLAGGVAHDFNNILTAIIGFGGLIQMNIKEDDPNNPYLKELLHAAERATHLTHGLLAFSRKQIINPQPVNINEIIRGMEKLLKRILREDIELKTIFADRDLNAMADEGQIEQVLMNLATNARDAMPEHGTLTISTEQVTIDDEFIKTHGYGREGEYVLISVSDTGAGMDEKIRERIFEPFFTTKEVGKGTGLGLSIAYGIIKQHEGYINCYSEPGMGTTFKIYLPETAIGGKEEKPSSEPSIIGGTETILLAEDDAGTRKLTKEVLVKFGYNVIEAVDGDEAVRKFAQNKDNIHLLIFDVIMPKKNGREAFKEIDNINPGVKTIFMSGYTADIIHEKGVFEEGINFITKPVSPKELLKKVREVLDEQKG